MALFKDASEVFEEVRSLLGLEDASVEATIVWEINQRDLEKLDVSTDLKMLPLKSRSYLKRRRKSRGIWNQYFHPL